MFPHTYEALEAKMKELKAQGYGSKPNESEELTDSDIDNLFECGQIGTEKTVQVTNLLHLSFSLVLGIQSRVEPRNLQWRTWNYAQTRIAMIIYVIEESDKQKQEWLGTQKT